MKKKNGTGERFRVENVQIFQFPNSKMLIQYHSTVPKSRFSRFFYKKKLFFVVFSLLELSLATEVFMLAIFKKHHHDVVILVFLLPLNFRFSQCNNNDAQKKRKREVYTPFHSNNLRYFICCFVFCFLFIDFQ